MGDNTIRNSYTSTVRMDQIGRNDTVAGSQAREIVSNDGDEITEKELTDAGVVIPDMTHLSADATVRKTEVANMTSALSQQLEGIGFKPEAAEAIAKKITALGNNEYRNGRTNDAAGFIQGGATGETVQVPDGTEKVQVGEKTTYTGVIDRKTWEAGIVAVQPNGWKPPFFVKDGATINANTQANFHNMIDKFGPSNPTGQQDFRTAIRNGFPGAAISDAECDQLLNLMQNADSGTDIKTIQTLLTKIDPKFSEVLNKNGGIDGKLGYATTMASQMLDAAVGMVEKKEPVFEERPKFKSVPVESHSQGSFKIDLDPPNPPHHRTHPSGGHVRGNGLHGSKRDWGSTKCPHF